MLGLAHNPWCRRLLLIALCLLPAERVTHAFKDRWNSQASAQTVVTPLIKEGVLKQSTVQSQKHIVAQAAFREAERLRSECSAESLRLAIKKYEEAQLLWQALNNRKQRASALKNIGDIYITLSENRKAIGYYNRALLLNRVAGDQRGEVETLNGIAFCYIDLGDTRKTFLYAGQAHSLSRQINDRRGEAQALNNIGLARYVSSDLHKSLDVLNQALALRQTARDERGQAETLVNIGYAHCDLGDLQKAIDSYNKALIFWQSVKDCRGEAQALTAIGGVYSFLGEKQKALDAHNRAVQIFRAIGDRNGEAATLNGIGYVYDDLADKERALDFYNKALQLYQATGNSGYTGLTMGYIGKVYDSLGSKQRALTNYKRKLSLSRSVGDLRMEAYALKDIGSVYDSWGDKPLALDYYNRALLLTRTLKDRRAQAYTLNNIGYIYELSGEKKRALAYYDQALPLIQAVEDRSGEILTLYHIAHAARDSGEIERACDSIKSAVSIIESLRMKIMSRELRASYLASVRQCYELYIDLLMQNYRRRPSDSLAAYTLAVSERARSRVLLDTLSEARVDIREGVDQELLNRERALQRQINGRAQYQMNLLNGIHAAEQIATIKNELEDLLAQYQEIEAQIRLQSPRYALLTQPQPLATPEIQRLLDSDTALLEYSLGDDRSYLWAVTQDSIAGYELPNRVEVEREALRFLDLLTGNQAVKDSTVSQSQRRLKEDDMEYRQQAARLSQVLLAPASSLFDRKRLLIVAEGVLQYIPFSALPVTRSAGQGQNYSDAKPLVAEHEIVSLPSASILSVLRQEVANRQRASRAIAVFADPVFETDDSRVLSIVNGKEMIDQTRHQIAGSRSSPGFPRLLSTRHEAEAVLAFAPAEKSLKAVDFKASRALAMSRELADYKIVHFATHGLLNSEHPELSAIVLSLVDERGDSQNGFLRLHDLYNMKMTADLVVLSACNTALGKDIKGEGLVGITRGFMYAGAARVVASLWKVDDDATAELMKSFYENMLKHDMQPSAALKLAQVKVWSQKQWRAPYYWAGFILQGDWK